VQTEREGGKGPCVGNAVARSEVRVNGTCLNVARKGQEVHSGFFAGREVVGFRKRREGVKRKFIAAWVAK